MPTYDHEAFIARALESLRAQCFEEWECIVVDDGSPDQTAAVVAPFLTDPRIRYERWPENRGLGAALNHGLAKAVAPLIAYLPSDDLYFADHLASLVDCLETHPGAALAYAGVVHHYNRTAIGQIPEGTLQLVQVLHRATVERWVERTELVTDDLDRMYWERLRPYGEFVGTGAVTGIWTDHPGQRHKIIQEPIGGINTYRARFGIRHPLRFASTVGNSIDEVGRYRAFRERPDTPQAADSLNILLVGELAYNAERVLALEERGHRLFGLWMPAPHWYNTVGPLPFGHVTDLPRGDWRAAIRAIRPDLIYALLNWQAVPFARAVHEACPDIPFVWHFKEGPFICIERGTWPDLLALYANADGQIYSSPEMRDWFDTMIPGLTSRAPTFVLDGDLPKRDWFAARRSPLLSEEDGEIHTVVPGRPIGLHPHTVAELAARRIHLHFYGDFTQGQWRGWIEKARENTGDYLHLHPNADQERWVAEFSRYDAGWLHFQRSENGGELRRANWDDLNYPARIATLAVAGVPLLQYDNRDAVVATDRLARGRDLGFFFRTIEELAARLCDRAAHATMRESIWRQRADFMFDTHADDLLAFFRRAIAVRETSRNR